MKTIIMGLLEDYIFDPSIVDLVLWFPHLDVAEFICATLAVLSWSWLSERLWRSARAALVILLAPLLGRYAFLLRYVR